MTIDIVKCTPAGVDFSLWVIPANFNYFVNTPVTPDSAGGIVNGSSTVKASTRRLYYNDTTPVNVGAHSRDYMYDPGRRVGNALPGFSFRLDDGVENRQFTLVGNVMDLHAYLVGEAKMALKLYTQGARYNIAEASGGTLIAS